MTKDEEVGMKSKLHFLVIGIGSIGERHIKNLKSLGVDVSVYDKYVDIFRPDVSLPKLTPQLTTMDRIIQLYDVNFANPENYFNEYDAFVICTPPSTHTEYIVLGMQHYSHIFVEKPISDKLEYLDWVAQTSRNKELVVQVGYQLRFHPGLRLVKKLLDEGRIGKLLSIKAEFGQYLPDWVPSRDYRKSYTANLGVILDASHEIDYVRWLAGSEVKQVSCFADKISSLEIDAEDTAEINLKFENGVIGNIHADMTNRIYTRCCKLIGTESTLFFNYNVSALLLGQNEMINFDVSDPYLEEMKHFISCIENKEKPLIDTLVGEKVLEIALAAKESSKENRVVEL